MIFNAKIPSDMYIRFLLAGLFLCLSCFATADSRESGVPYITDTTKADGMALAPGAERLYVLYQSVLFRYELNPLRKIGSVRLELDYERDFFTDDRFRPFISADEKTLILYTPAKLVTVNTETGRVLKTVEHKSEHGILNGDVFFTITETYGAVIWRVDDLTPTKQFRLDFRVPSSGIDGYGMNKCGDKILFFQRSSSGGGGVAAALNSQTYQTDAIIGVQNEIIAIISEDCNRLYVDAAWQIDDRLTGTVHTISDMGFTKRVTFNFDSREVVYGWQKKDGGVINDPNEIGAEFGFSSYIFSYFRYFQLSYTNAYGLSFVNTTGFLRFPSEKKSKKIYFFDDGEMVIMEHSRFFQFTDNARKHIKMKHPDGSIGPIDDSTFKKYTTNHDN